MVAGNAILAISRGKFLRIFLRIMPLDAPRGGKKMFLPLRGLTNFFLIISWNVTPTSLKKSAGMHFRLKSVCYGRQGEELFLAKRRSPLYGVRQNLISMLTRWKWLPQTLVRFLTTPGGKLVDFYDGGDHVHIWGLKFRKDEYLGSEILRTEKIYLGV